ncbi:MAG: nitroreductase family protein [Bacteroidota bacterium]|nr:nitroreductase family protein [Bacteroidota bacterium]
MNFLDFAHKRYSCRDYTEKPLARELIEEVLEAGRIAPSAVNYQPWHFIVINEQEMLEKIRGTYARSWFRSAPVVLVLCIDYNVSWKRADGKEHGDIDIAIASDHMTLQATSMGLATCWVCNFDRDKCKEVLKLPEHIEPLVYLPLGYPADEPSANHDKRKELKDIVHWNKFEK